MSGVFYVVSSAAPSHVAGDTVARNRRGTPRRSIAHKRVGPRIRARTSNASCVARRVAENTRGRAARPNGKSAGRERRRQKRRQCASGCGGARRASSAFQNRGSENRLASASSHPSNSVTTFASELKKSSAFSPNAPARPLDFLNHRLYDTYSHDRARTPFHQTEVGAYASCPCRSSRCNFEHRGALGTRRDGYLRAGREAVGEARRGT